MIATLGEESGMKKYLFQTLQDLISLEQSYKQEMMQRQQVLGVVMMLLHAVEQEVIPGILCCITKI